MTKIEVVKEGKIIIDSGKMVIVDPCFLHGFDREAFMEIDEKLGMERLNLEMERELAYQKVSATMLEEADLLLAGKSDLAKAKGIEYHELKRKVKKLDKIRENYQNPTGLTVPHFAQADGYVYFSNPIGDGSYPVVKTPRRLKILFDYPIKDGELDESRLGGEYMGRSDVESGTLVAMDLSKAIIMPEYDKCIVSLKNGVYSCKFANDKKSFSISI